MGATTVQIIVPIAVLLVGAALVVLADYLDNHTPYNSHGKRFLRGMALRNHRRLTTRGRPGSFRVWLVSSTIVVAALAWVALR